MDQFKSIGKDVFIDSRAIIKRPHLVEFGDHCAVDAGVYITTAAFFGSYIHIGPYVTIIGGEKSEFIAENFCTIAAGSRIICKGEEHLGFGLIGPTIPYEYSDKYIGGKIVISQFANVLTNAVIFPGVTIGEGAVIGANTVMHVDAEPWTIYMGNPARKIKKRDGAKMKTLADQLLKVI